MTVHLASGGLLASTVLRVHGLPVTVPLVALTVTAPVGVAAPTPEVSVTVIVQVVIPPVVTLAGVHDTAVVVECPTFVTLVTLVAVFTLRNPLQIVTPGTQSLTAEL